MNKTEKTYLLRGKTTLFEANYRPPETKYRQDVYHDPIKTETLKESFQRLKKEKEAKEAEKCNWCLIL